jgi:streptogramin lyase
MDERRSPVAAMAAFAGCTEGQLYTMLVALAIAVALAVSGIPAVLRERESGSAAGAGLRPFSSGESEQQSAAPVVAATGSSPAVESEVIGPTRVTAPRRAASSASSSTRLPGVFARVPSPGAPGGIAVAPDGTVYVTTDNGTAAGERGPSHVFGFSARGALVSDRIAGDQRADHRFGLSGIAVDPLRGDVTVLDRDGARVIAVDSRSGVMREVTKVPDLPACVISVGAAACQSGVEDRAPMPIAAAYAPDGTLFFTDPAQETVWRLRPGAATPEIWFQSPYFTQGDGPFGIDVQERALTFTVGSTVDPSAFGGGGGLYRVPIGDDGSAGDLALVHAFASGDAPGAVAVAPNGSSYVLLRGRNAIVLVAPDGTTTKTIEPPAGSAVRLDSPFALALVLGALLVANGHGSTDTGRWAVLEIPLGEGTR